jgi:acetolactate synthase-1/2/3 large subunit
MEKKGLSMKGSQAVVLMLEQIGVEVVFGLCGDTSLPLYEDLWALKSGVKHILTRDERSASFMADAYARFSGRVGVCEGPSGGGATYIMPGVAEANQSSVPLVCISSDIDVRDRGRGTLTELDQDALFSPITVWSKTPTHSQELPRVIREAFRQASSGRLGATHICLPLSIQEADVADEDVYIDPRYASYPAARTAPELGSVARAANQLLESKSPVLVAGAGVMRSEAWSELKRLTELLGCPVATSISGKGALAETHQYSLGVIGSNGGLSYRHEFIKSADLVFYIGCHAGSVTTIKWTLPADRSVKVIQLDVDPARIGVNYQVGEGIVSDAKLGLTALVEEIEDRLGGGKADKTDPDLIADKRNEHMSAIEEFYSDAQPITPERFVNDLAKVLPANALVITDPGTATPYMAAYYRLPQAGRWFVTPRAHGALGYSLPAVVGAHFARPEQTVVGIMGDGSFAISAGELETIVRLNAPVVLIVLTNSCFGWVKAGQKALGVHYFGVDFSTTDHAKVALAYGIKAERVDDPADLNRVLSRAIESQGPVLVDVVVQPLQEANAPVSKWIA